jgi:hypothetical protein
MQPQFACAQRLQVPLDSAAAQKTEFTFNGTCEVVQANVHGTEFGRVPYARSEIFSDRPVLTRIRHWHLTGHIDLYLARSIKCCSSWLAQVVYRKQHVEFEQWLV